MALTITSLSPTGLSYITSVVRESEELSTWFCYFIPAQLLGNWVQFLRHRSFVPISVDNYPGYVHTYVRVLSEIYILIQRVRY